MIANEKIAKEISELMLDYGARLNASTALVRDNCATEEVHVYRKAVGKVMGEMLLAIMNPLYERHPNLVPPELRRGHE